MVHLLKHPLNVVSLRLRVHFGYGRAFVYPNQSTSACLCALRFHRCRLFVEGLFCSWVHKRVSRCADLWHCYAECCKLVGVSIGD